MSIIGLCPSSHPNSRLASANDLTPSRIAAIEQPQGKTLTPNPKGLVDFKAVDMDGKTIVCNQVKPANTERYRFKEKIYVRRNAKSKPELTSDDSATWWPKRQRGDV